jgi:tetratricopeptide (TPR) repeat protein
MIKYSVIAVGVLCRIFIFGGVPVYPQHSGEYYYEKGLIEYRSGMYKEAIFNMRKCLEENPRSFEAANVLAEISYIKNKIFEAIEYYKQSLIINDNQPDIHCIIGELYEFTSEKDPAFRHFTRATEIDRNHIRAHCNLVRFFIEKNDRVSAESHFKISYIQAMQRSGRLLSEASDAEREGKLGKAVALYKKAVDEGPSILEAYLRLYEIYRRMNDYKAAAEILEKLKFIRPDYEKAYVLLGSLYFTQKLPGKRKMYIDKAIANLKKAIELNPSNYETCYTLSDVFRFVRKYDEARTYEEKAREIEKRSADKK